MQKLPEQFAAAVQLHRSGKIGAAIDLYLKILPRQKNNAQLLYLLGTAYLQAGRLSEGIAEVRRSLAIAPDNPDALNNLGNALKGLGRPDEALATYDRALALRPDYGDAHFNRANVLQDLGRHAEALAAYEQALALRPDHAEAHNNRANALKDLGRPDEALAGYDRALAARRNYAEAYNNRGVVLKDLKRHAEALADYERALALRPDYPEAHYNRGNALAELKRHEEALASYERALAGRPDYADAHHNRGNVLKDLKRYAEASASYERALALRPDYPFLRGKALQARMQQCVWRGLEADLQALAAGISAGRPVTPPFELLGVIDDPALQLAAARLFARERYPEGGAVVGTPTPGRKIRIGYYSADFHNHATTWLMAELFEAHDVDAFEVHGFSFGPDKNDEMRRRVSSALHRFHEVSARSDREIAELSRTLGIDIAVDLKGYTGDSRTGIFAQRCAPIQVSYLGYPGTMGAPYIDYLVADPTLIPEADRRHYSEKICYLPHSYQVNDSRRAISERVFSRAEAGLPASGFVFCCFNNNYKILPATFDGWMRILKAVEGSVLWLLEDNPAAAANLREAARARGVAEGRLVFAPKLKLDEHLARHRLADLFLDTLPYNAHTTTSDALWAGLPVLTRIGRSFAARVAASLINAVGIPELITGSQADYEAMAIELARQPAALARIRTTLARNRSTSPLFDGRRFARDIEAAYAQMIGRHRAGLQPEHLFVAAGHPADRAG
ncbi:tetratricopeptide repeat protein [Parasulfuritortus cantonensis]|uniref:protein O-GlcNAc transferase n=1 Tax=Parasulfuritortus cantonensis TaxID=2528202 RepID=A0A4R1B7U8_9PROT|nr:tetratricopeptide repeat protein [Parasulfuritortus cantonensis]TCJ12748.1 tetratricopeptide repeat protein [Parasulfuritortus cantonensis]